MPQQVMALSGISIAGADAGENSSVAWTAGGKLLTWGSNCCGNLGHEDRSSSENRPKVVQALEGKHVVCAAIGANHMLVSTAAHELFACGHGECGELGLGSAVSQSGYLTCIPTAVPLEEFLESAESIELEDEVNEDEEASTDDDKEVEEPDEESDTDGEDPQGT